MALANVLGSLALSTGDDLIGTVVSRVEDHFHIAPDGAVVGVGLVARLNRNDSAPRLGLESSDLGGLGIEFTSHRSIEASFDTSLVLADGLSSV